MTFVCRFRRLFIFIVITGLLPLNAVAQEDNVDGLTKKLIELRGEVEDLSNELNLLKEEYKQDMKSLYAQRSDLEANIQRQQRNIKKLNKNLAENKEIVRKIGADAATLKPVLINAIDAMAKKIKNGMPFKQEDRLADLQEIKQQLQSDVVPAQRAANRLWAFYEDELRLTRENSIYRQSIQIDDSEMLADVAKVGMVMMYFKTSDDRYGKAQNVNGDWNYVVLDSGSEEEMIERLFDSLQKQIRTGYFELPNALPVTGDAS